MFLHKILFDNNVIFKRTFQTLVSLNLLSQALNNSCSHYIKKFQVSCLRIVSERVRDSTKAYRTI